MSKFNEIINGDKPVLIDFSAEWCQPCKMMGPILKQVASQMGDKVRILKVDIDKNPAIAQKWAISGVPTLMVIKNGKQLFRQSGVIQTGQIVQLLNGFL